jgi:hypothetical protein
MLATSWDDAAALTTDGCANARGRAYRRVRASVVMPALHEAKNLPLVLPIMPALDQKRSLPCL